MPRAHSLEPRRSHLAPLPACVPYSYTCPRSAQDLLAAARGASVSVPFRARLVQKGAIKMLDLLETSTLVPGPDGGWLYAAGDVSYEATPIVEGDAAELDRSTDQEQ